MTRLSTIDLAEHLDEILERVRDTGEQFVIERDGAALAVIQPASAGSGPTLHQLPTLLADIPWPDPEFFADLESIHHEMNVPIEPPRWP